MERAGRVDRYELHLHPLAREPPRPAPRGVQVDDLRRDALKGPFGHREVDEAGAGHGRRLHVARGRQDGGDARGEIARIQARGAGQPERGRAGEIAVPGVAGALDHDRGHRLDVELSAGAKGADRARDERFESAFQGFLPASDGPGFILASFSEAVLRFARAEPHPSSMGSTSSDQRSPRGVPDPGDPLDPGPQERLEVRARGRSQQELRPIAPALSFHGRGHRTHHLDAGAMQLAGELARGREEPVARLAHRRLGAQQDEAGEGGQPDRVPLRQGLDREGGIALAGERGEERMAGTAGLHDHLPREGSPPGASRDLGDELGHPFRGPEVGTQETRVRVHDPDQGHAGEIVSLREHLGADEEVRRPVAGRPHHPVELAPPACRVPVDAQHPGGREPLREPFRESLGPAPDGDQIGGIARAAAHREALFRPAVVAAQPAVGAVQDEPRIAVAALHRLPAVMADHHRREPAAIDEEERLLAPPQPFVDGLDQPLGESGRQRLAPYVVEHDPRHPGPARPLREPKPPAPPPRC